MKDNKTIIRHNVNFNQDVSAYLDTLLTYHNSLTSIIINWNQLGNNVVFNDVTKHTYIGIENYIVIVQKITTKHQYTFYVLKLNEETGVFDFDPFSTAKVFSLLTENISKLADRKKLTHLFEFTGINSKAFLLHDGANSSNKETFHVKVSFTEIIKSLEEETIDFSSKHPTQIALYCTDLLSKFKKVTFNLNGEQQLTVSKEVVSTVNCVLYFDIYCEPCELTTFDNDLYRSSLGYTNVKPVEHFIPNPEDYTKLISFVNKFRYYDTKIKHESFQIFVQKPCFIYIEDYWKSDENSNETP